MRQDPGPRLLSKHCVSNELVQMLDVNKVGSCLGVLDAHVQPSDIALGTARRWSQVYAVDMPKAEIPLVERRYFHLVSFVGLTQCLCFAQRNNWVANLNPATANYARCDSSVATHCVVRARTEDGLHARARRARPRHFQQDLITNPYQSPVTREG